MTRRLPWVLLAVSLGLNAVLLLRGVARLQQDDPTAGGAQASTAPVPRPDTSTSGPSGRPGSALTPLRGAPVSSEAVRAAVLEAKVASLEQELFRRLPLHERFERSTGGSGAEANLRPALDGALASAGVGSWSIACRGEACRPEVLSGKGEANSWMMPLQGDDDVRRWVKGWSFGPATPKTDPVSGRSYEETEVFLDVRSEPDTLSPEFFRRVHEFRISSALADCTHGFAERGTYEARVELAPPSLTVISAGSLGGEAVRCLEARLRAAVAPLTGARGSDGVVAYVELVSPPAP